jgi:Mg2+/Co2+ transporter CorB
VPTASPLSTEELRTLVLEGAHFIPSKQQSILLNLFELEKITVEDVMTPRNQIEAINLDDPQAEIQNELANCQHTRLPIYQEKLDNIIGIVHARRALKQIKNGELNVTALRGMLQEPYFIPSTTPLIAQLQHFQESRRRLALVVDEYGELLGLISLEDILEEIVGDFAVHSPLHSSPYVQEKDGSWLVDGGVLLRNLNRKLGFKFPVDGPKTLNGLILEHLEDIPETGTSLKIAGQSLEIIQTQDRIVKVVRIVPQSAK